MGVVALVQGRAGSLYSPPDYSKGYGCGCNRNIDRLAKYRKHKGRKEGGGRDVGRAGEGEGGVLHVVLLASEKDEIETRRIGNPRRWIASAAARPDIHGRT